MLKILRKIRKRTWTTQILLGDIIALLNGRFIARYFRKKGNKAAGRLVNNLKVWR